ncbi:hypothetical protein CcaverHIS631_0600120 [Cutaneotrichosporon cavernicola]|nr:hypothetical protein CcaverHIS631_0600120 [Cutaneotrichosporon cavernicola]
MATPKSRQACLGCRRIKVACDNPQTGEQCKRCVHTVSFLRTSSMLFTTILAAASKYALPERHGTLLAHAESLINRATNGGECCTALIQSLLILVYYKGPTDRSAWLKIGIAIRFAFQLRWHEARPSMTLPADEHEARLILDPERTWFCLVCFDRQYADIFGLPTTIPMTDYGDCEAWARSHFHLNIPVDIHLACSHAMVVADEFWGRIRKDHDEMPRRLVRTLLTSLYNQTVRHRRKWFPRDVPPAPTHLQPARNLMEMFALSHQLIIKHHLLILAEPLDAEILLPECVEHATNVVAAFEVVSKDGSPRYLHDAGATTLSNLGLVLYKLFWRLGPDTRPYLIEVTKRARDCCPPEGPLMYTARFLDRVLGLFQTAVAEDAVPAAEVGPPDQSQIDEFLRLAGSDLNQFMVNDDYWASLLSSSLEDPVYPSFALGM